MLDGNYYNSKDYTNADINISYINAIYRLSNNIENWKYNPQVHYSLLLYIVEGEALFYINNKSYLVKKNNVVFVPMNSEFHSRGYKGFFKYISIQFVIDKKYNLYPFQTVYNLSSPDYFYNMFSDMCDVWERKSIGYMITVKLYIYRILNKLLLEETNNNDSLKNLKVIKNSVKYMEENLFDSKLSIDKIAEASGFSVTYFRRIFREVYGVSPIKYINKIKITKAKELLEHSYESVSNISDLVGYSNVYYFIKIFKKMVGITPLEYRLECSNNK